MTNREWLFEEMKNMSDEEFAEMISNGIDTDLIIPCNPHCDYSSECEDCTINWLKAEHKEKITLSEAERIILENLPEEYTLIARDKEGTLKIGVDKLVKSDRGFWYHVSCSKYTNLEVFNHLFQFITWNDSEPYNIEELLKEE